VNITGTASGMLSRVLRPSFPFLSGIFLHSAAQPKHQLNAFSFGNLHLLLVTINLGLLL
jgi:hypothetical protein